MKIKQKILNSVLFAAVLLGSSLFFAVAASPSVMAYTCAKSGPNGDGKASGGQTLEYKGGSCIFMKPDKINNDSKTPVLNPDGTFSGRYSCGGGTVSHSDGNCWTYRPEYTNEKATYDNGSAVPVQTWEAICSKEGKKYNNSRHRCETGGLLRDGCTGLDSDSTGDNCRGIGDNTPTPEEISADPTSSNANPGQNGNKTCYKPDGSTVEVKSNQSCPSGTTATQGGTGNFNPNTSTKECGGAQTNIISCQGSDGVSTITDILKQILIILTTGVGIVAVGGILYGAILYASAQDNAGQTKKGIEVITNTVIGLLLYLFMFAILNLLIPGGVLT